MKSLRLMSWGLATFALTQVPVLAQQGNLPTPHAVEMKTVRYIYSNDGTAKEEPKAEKVESLPPVSKTQVIREDPALGLPESCCEHSCCDKKMHAMAFGDFLYLTARGADVSFVQPRDGVVPTAVPRGPVGVADPDYSAGFRVGGGYALDDRSAIVATYTWFDSSTTSEVRTQTPFVQHALVTFPSTVNAAAGSNAATAIYGIDFRTVDVDYKRIFSGGCNYQINWLVGARYAHLDQDFNSSFSILGNTNVNTSIDFDGGGFRGGLEGEYVSSSTGLLMYGRATGSLVVGHWNADYTQNNRFAGLQAATSFTDDRVVPILDTELGVGWVGPKGHLRFTVGYMVAAWFNTILTPDFIKGVQASNFTTNGYNMDNTITFDGFVSRLEVRF